MSPSSAGNPRSVKIRPSRGSIAAQADKPGGMRLVPLTTCPTKVRETLVGNGFLKNQAAPGKRGIWGSAHPLKKLLARKPLISRVNTLIPLTKLLSFNTFEIVVVALFVRSN